MQIAMPQGVVPIAAERRRRRRTIRMRPTSLERRRVHLRRVGRRRGVIVPARDYTRLFLTVSRCNIAGKVARPESDSLAPDHTMKLFHFARVVTPGFLGIATLAICLDAQTSAQQAGGPPAASPRRLVDRYCATCHNERLKTADLKLDQIDVDNPSSNAEVWEKVVRKVHTGTMPPPNMPQPTADERRALL